MVLLCIKGRLCRPLLINERYLITVMHLLNNIHMMNTRYLMNRRHIMIIRNLIKIRHHLVFWINLFLGIIIVVSLHLMIALWKSLFFIKVCVFFCLIFPPYFCNIFCYHYYDTIITKQIFSIFRIILVHIVFWKKSLDFRSQFIGNGTFLSFIPLHSYYWRVLLFYFGTQEVLWMAFMSFVFVISLYLHKILENL